jgi:hypothetical protein
MNMENYVNDKVGCCCDDFSIKESTKKIPKKFYQIHDGMKNMGLFINKPIKKGTVLMDIIEGGHNRCENVKELWDVKSLSTKINDGIWDWDKFTIDFEKMEKDYWNESEIYDKINVRFSQNKDNKLVLEAIRDINEGEELLRSYGIMTWYPEIALYYDFKDGEKEKYKEWILKRQQDYPKGTPLDNLFNQTLQSLD